MDFHQTLMQKTCVSFLYVFLSVRGNLQGTIPWPLCVSRYHILYRK